MLNHDQRQRVSLLKTMRQCSRKEAIEALEKNFWDTSMASEWIKLFQENSDLTLEAFHQKYDEARSKAAELPSDRYDLQDSNRKPNRAERRAAKKNKKANGKEKS